MSNKTDKKTLVIMEHDWGHSFGPNCSVYPFIDGANEINTMDKQQYIAHYTYTDLNDFRTKFLEATEDKEDTYIIYVAAHGNNKSVGSSWLSSILIETKIRAEQRNIEGILVGSCLTGNSESYYNLFMKGCSLRWAIAYKCSIGWLDGTIVDTRLLDTFLHAGHPPDRAYYRLLLRQPHQSTISIQR